MQDDPMEQAKAAIRHWTGVECPNPAGRRALDDFPALIAEFAALRGSLAFEEEPAAFEAVLREEKEQDT
jgi:hypothetical protein